MIFLYFILSKIDVKLGTVSFFYSKRKKGHFSLSNKLFLEFEFQVITYYVKLKEIWCKLSRKSCTCKKED